MKKQGYTYEGAWEYDIKHGKGKMTMPSGVEHLAIWEYDRLNGKGTYINAK